MHCVYVSIYWLAAGRSIWPWDCPPNNSTNNGIRSSTPHSQHYPLYWPYLYPALTKMSSCCSVTDAAVPNRWDLSVKVDTLKIRTAGFMHTSTQTLMSTWRVNKHLRSKVQRPLKSRQHKEECMYEESCRWDLHTGAFHQPSYFHVSPLLTRC